MKWLDSPWVRFFVDNLGWILISIILASMIWIVATLEDNPIEVEQYQNPITIEFIQPSSESFSLFRSTTLRSSAFVTVRAPRRSLEDLQRSDLRVYADLSGLSAGTHTVELIGEIVDDGPSGRVVEISPADITVEIVEVITDDNVPLRLDTPGELAPGFQLANEITCTPNTFSVSGPRSIVNSITRGVVRIDLQNSDTSFERRYVIEPRGINDQTLSINERSNIQIEPRTVACNVVVSAIEGGTELLVGEPNFTGELPEGYIRQDFTIDPPSVFVTGSPEIIDTLSGIVETAEIALDGQTDDFIREVAVILPEGLTAQPATVSVAIAVDPRIITREFTSVTVRSINVAPSLSVTSLVPQSVDLTVSGPEPIVTELTLEDFRVFVDLQGRGSGTYSELPLSTEVLRSVNLGTLTITTQPQSVNVVIALPPTPTPSINVWGG